MVGLQIRLALDGSFVLRLTSSVYLARFRIICGFDDATTGKRKAGHACLFNLMHAFTLAACTHSRRHDEYGWAVDT